MRKHDVFLSYPSADKPAVRRLAKLLIKQGIKPWFDERDLIPGRPWQEALEETIVNIRSVAIMVGKLGIGPWEDREMRAFLSEFVRREIRQILCCFQAPRPHLDLRPSPREFTWVDLRSGIKEKDVERLIWGVTGVTTMTLPLPVLHSTQFHNFGIKRLIIATTCNQVGHLSTSSTRERRTALAAVRDEPLGGAARRP